jgi:hypothetical protein
MASECVGVVRRVRELLLNEDVADRDRLKLGSEIAIIGVRPRDAAEADAEQVAVDGDDAVVGLASVLAHAVAEADERDVGRLDGRGDRSVPSEVVKLQHVQILEVVAHACGAHRPSIASRPLGRQRRQDAPVECLH